MSLKGRIIVVTGAGRGLGRAFAEACLAAHAASVVIADIDATLGEATAAALRTGGRDVHFIAYDQGDPASIEAFGVELARRFDRIDGLVNNAAIATGIGGKTYDEIDIDTWDRVMRVNVRGLWLVVKALAPLLKKSKLGGRIVNVASDTALWGAPRLLHYVGSKGAVISMTRALARELGPDEITVNAIAPGITIVEATEYVPQERHDLYVNNRAIQRKQMPDDTVGPVIYLLGPGAGFVTGQLLPVNGGFVCN
jgi:NAD(P)-dependent dehydrogenase (short-subunit alcohol dehydrogenase family)